ncbi:MAG: Unknown protein [uncultured Thiotrichaceae bacterium]|uniref:Uncharacterized protein n=1 Tax=uncultured Thiotrichaceae bacterium TaxID=298394 RepID=A0A6S6TW12_9GAMM|nr:MAG: Unknown protein [uncultured Thiotrichaceae bacterium]
MRLTHGLTLFAILLLQACGGNNGDGGGDDGGDPEPNPEKGRLVVYNSATDNKALPVRNVPFITAPTVAAKSGNTNTDGGFEYLGAESVTFTLLGKQFGPIAAKATVGISDLADSYCKDSDTPISCQYQVRRNIQRTLLSVDADENYDNGITIYDDFSSFPMDPESSIDDYELALSKKLLKEGRQAAAVFSPSLGINLEEPQPEADDVGGQPIPFADLFRIARPFPEYSCTEIEYDAQGWPKKIPDSCAEEKNDIFKIPTYALAFMLRGVPFGTLPTGKYTVLYEGSGIIQYDGIGTKVIAESSPGRDILEVTPDLLKNRAAAGLRVFIKSVVEDNHIRNLRIIMPGGICAGNPFIRVDNADECPAGDYRNFVETYEQDTNAIVFNPEFMRFLKDFKTIRMMNFMKASPRNPCFEFQDEEYFECILQEFTWSQRAKMDDAMWGGSFRTDLAERAGRGVPLEVTVALANQLQRDPWFNIPHNATDDYVEKYATYVRNNLDSKLKAHIEYSNEPWNGPFWANPYTIEMGKRNGVTGSNDYWTGLLYYTERSVEIFDIWQEVWGGTDRLFRIINTQHNGGSFASRNMLKHKGAYQSIDAIASGPYFFGCWDRAGTQCKDEALVPKLLKDVTSVDDIFEILDDPNNPYGLEKTIEHIKLQAEAAKDYDVDLYAYEGGQHLTVVWGDGNLDTARKLKLLDLFRAANRDSRMAGRYIQLLDGWKANGGKLFALYTLPQTYHNFGSFGIKEHMGQKRSDAPKYDGSMKFQENQRKCWWDNCE